MTLSHEKCVLLVNTKKSVYPAITIRKVTKKDVVLLPYVIKAHHKPTCLNEITLRQDVVVPMRQVSSARVRFGGGDSDDD